METVNLYPHIFTRASTRNFDSTPLTKQTLDQIESFISGVKPLLPDVKLTHRIVGFKDVKGVGVPNAPHFLLISGIEQPLRNICAGFLYQYAELYMYSIGLATRWLGMTKGKEADPNHIITMAFGKPAQSATRTLAEFNRKSVAEIAKGNDPRFEAARLAPSGLNKQPWYFISEGNAIHVYYQKSLGGLIGAMYKLTDLDTGIALCHLAVASAHEGKPFNFTTSRTNTPTPPKGFTYIGTVE